MRGRIAGICLLLAACGAGAKDDTPASGSLLARVRLTDTTPVTGCYARILGSPWHASCDAAGSFVMSGLLTGVRDLEITALGVGLEDLAPSTTSIAINADETESLDITLYRAGAAHGHVVNAMSSALISSSGVFSVSGDGGLYFLPGIPPGQRTVSAYIDQGAIQRDVQIEPDQVSAPVDLQFPSLQILTGQVKVTVEARGIGAEDIQIHVFDARTGLEVSISSPEGAASGFTFQGPPGPYWVTISTVLSINGQSVPISISRMVTIDPAGVALITLTLPVVHDIDAAQVGDIDGDGISDSVDTDSFDPRPDHSIDTDGNGLPDASDLSQLGVTLDGDADGIANGFDNCLFVANPTQIDSNQDGIGDACQLSSLAAGLTHSCAVNPQGQLKCWGKNDFGALGLEDMLHRGDGPGEMGAALPVINVGSGRTVRMVTGGQSTTCALLDNGTVKCWGNNMSGQLGVGDQQPVGDQVGDMGDNLLPIPLGNGRTAVAITEGLRHVCALLDDATVKCWGSNGNGELGLGDANNRGDGMNEMGDSLPAVDLGLGRTAKAVSAGDLHTCAILDNDSVKCWGDNFYGGLGLGDSASRGTGLSSMGDMLPAVDLGTGRTAKSISAGGSTTCAILDNDTLKCWGYNSFGQVGQGDGMPHGDAPGEMGDNLNPVELGVGRSARSVDVGQVFVCARLDNDTVKCWGRNLDGELGQGDNADRGDSAGEMAAILPVDVGSNRTVIDLATGGAHVCARLDDLTIKCWGSNSEGQLGLGNTSLRGAIPGQMGDALPVVVLE